MKYKVWMGSSKDSKREGWWKPHPVLDHLGLISNEYTVILKFLKGSNVEFLNLRFCCYFYRSELLELLALAWFQNVIKQYNWLREYPKKNIWTSAYSPTSFRPSHK